MVKIYPLVNVCLMKGSGSDTTRAIFQHWQDRPKTLFGYESGERAPDALALAAWAKSGLDVLYVVTGQRQGVPAPAPAQEQEAPLAPTNASCWTTTGTAHPDAQAALKATSDCVRATFEEENGMTNKGRQMDFKVLLGAVMLAGLSVAGCSTKTMADSRN
ncbi:hypothetical protein ACNUI5_09170 [Pseudomonas aeruginosa]